MGDIIVWTDGIEIALNDIRDKCLSNSEYHKKNYYFFKGYLKYFRIPTIILSGLNSVFSVGLQPYIGQGIISVLCCSISLICGIIASVELFLALQNIMEKEIISSKEFYILSCDIFKTLSVEREYRMINGKIYLDNIHTKFCNLIDQSILLDKDDIITNFKSLLSKKTKENKEFQNLIQNDIEKIYIYPSNTDETIIEDKNIKDFFNNNIDNNIDDTQISLKNIENNNNNNNNENIENV